MPDKKPPLRVLIADDSQFFRVMLSDLLTDEGFEVLMAKDGVEAMEIVRQEYVTLSLVVLDMAMPNKDGAEVLGEIKANPKTESLPIVMVTGEEVDSSKVEDLRAMGACGFVSKAMPSKELIFRVKSVVEEHTGSKDAPSQGVQVNLMVDYMTEKGTFSALCYRLAAQWIDLRTIQPLEVDAECTLSFTLPGGSNPLQTRGKVLEVRSQEQVTGTETPPGMRVQFASTSPSTLDEIRDFVQRKTRQS
ncbi:MAG: response regulator [Acidobacteria bacterium]|nr:response regulator [Acidobacteriota bacterium]